ncbi:ribonuclease H-like domain-containing protein [Crassisporium funariophilum]|nr:ribonuclease H-like domain-containing protein [Crassisporium funariophilum]
MSAGTSKVKAPSSNWAVLQKQLASTSTADAGRKRRKLDNMKHDHKGSSQQTRARPASFSPEPVAKKSYASHVLPDAQLSGSSSGTVNPDMKNGESRAALQQMVLGHQELSENQQLPGRYLALDCEMVGVGIDGAESSLARVSLVNFYGAVIMDEFVRQRERVVDYRTQWSGIRETDMINAKPFEEVQKRVDELLKDRILIGHAVHNDMKALLLSHPRPLTRDTQFYAHKSELCKTRRVALRNLVKQEIDLTIQSGEHSSVTDARATMAVYRLHKKDWEKGNRPIPLKTTSAPSTSTSTATQKRKRSSIGLNEEADQTFEADEASDFESEAETKSAKKTDPSTTPASAVGSKTGKKGKNRVEEGESSSFPGGGRKGVSSGLGTVVRRGGHLSGGGKARGGAAQKGKNEWWKQLPGGVSGGAKGTMRVSMKK